MKYINVYCKDTQELVNSYSKYLKTQHCNNLKMLLENLTNNYCMECKEKFKKSFLVHKVFTRLGNEKITDIEILCEKCYNKKSKIDFKFTNEIKKRQKNCTTCKYSKMMLMKHIKTKDTKELYCNIHCCSIDNKENICKQYKKRSFKKRDC